MQRILGQGHEVQGTPLMVTASIGLFLNVVSGLILAKAMGNEVHALHGHHGHHDHHDHHDHKNCGHNHDHRHGNGDHGNHSLNKLAPLESVQAQAEAKGQAQRDRNLQSALLHIWSDALSSVAVIAGAVVMAFTDWAWIDSALAILITGMILRWSFSVLRDAMHVLLEGTPTHLNAADIEQAILAIDLRVKRVVDMHLWEITSKMYAASLEVYVATDSLPEAEKIRERISALLREKYGIGHSVISMQPKS